MFAASGDGADGDCKVRSLFYIISFYKGDCKNEKNKHRRMA
nr:MAG TPA: hypothetical protein [Caudoviricetes sp.]